MFAKTLVLWQTVKTTTENRKGIFAGKGNQELQNEPSMAFCSCSQLKILNAHTHVEKL